MFPYERIIVIDRKSKLPVYRQIAISIINAIRSGTLKAGVRLPGSRTLAQILGVHRKTVIAGYEELDAQDWVTIVPGRYIAVSENIPSVKPQHWAVGTSASSYEGNFSLPVQPIRGKVERGALDVIPEIVIDDGRPDVRLSPIDALLKTYRIYTSRKPAIKHAHLGTDQGTDQLRKELTNYLSATRGLNISPGNMLITHGAQMGIYLAARLLLSAGATVIVGQPNYTLASHTFQQTGARLTPVPVDDSGMDTLAIEKICKKRKVAAVYVIPHHHYPTTVTMRIERRMHLLELSRRYSFAVIEDDYDYDYHYSSAPYLPLASGSHNGNIIYIGSFSKILDPSLRIGFMVGPENFIEQSTAYRRIVDVGGDGYMQNALAELIHSGELTRHLKKAKKCYHARRDFLDAMLREKLGNAVSYQLPTGGMAIWLKLDTAIPVARLNADHRLHIIRTDPEENAFRFGFASMNEAELQQAVGYLQYMLQKA